MLIGSGWIHCFFRVIPVWLLIHQSIRIGLAGCWIIFQVDFISIHATWGFIYLFSESESSPSVASSNFYTCHWHRARITEPYSHPFAGASGGKTKPLVPSSDDLCSDLSISFRFDWYLESDLTRKKWRRSLMNRKLNFFTKNYNSTLTHSCCCSRAGRCWSMECQSQLQLVRCRPPYEPHLSLVAE